MTAYEKWERSGGRWALDQVDNVVVFNFVIPYKFAVLGVRRQSRFGCFIGGVSYFVCVPTTKTHVIFIDRT